jgi:Fe-S cluster assembly protein SufB
MFTTPPLIFRISYIILHPGKKAQYESLDEVDPELLATFEKLGIPLNEQKVLAGVAVDAVMDSVSVATTFRSAWPKKELSFARSVKHFTNASRILSRNIWAPWYPTPITTMRLSTQLFSATAPSVTFPKGVRCPMELSTYFRINAANTGQFERTLIVAEEGSYVSYMEGCTAPMRDDQPASRCYR